MSPAAPGNNARGIRYGTQRIERRVAAVARINVEDDEAAASGYTDVRVGPLGEPRKDLVGVGRGTCRSVGVKWFFPVRLDWEDAPA